MNRRARIPHLGGARVIVLHRPHPGTAPLMRQLAAIGLKADEAWPELPADGIAADFLLFDADMGFDGQFPWAPGEAPMPLVALMGSEAPGRVEWALRQGAGSTLRKPLGDAGAYSALLIARQAFEARLALSQEIMDLKARLAGRETLVQAVLVLVRSGVAEAEAYAHLRQMAMAARITIEEAAARIVAVKGGCDAESRRA